MRRAIGYLMIAIGVLGIVLSVAGIVVGFRIVDQVAAGVDNGLSLALRTLDRVQADLEQVKVTVQEVSAGIEAARQTVVSAGEAVSAASPIVDEVAQAVSQVGQKLDNTAGPLAEVLSGLTSVAKTVDDISKLISNLSFLLPGTVPKIETSLEEPIAETSAALRDLSRSIGTIEEDLTAAAAQVDRLSENFEAVADSLDAINESLLEFIPSLDEYAGIGGDVQDGVEQLRAEVEPLAGRAKIAVIVVAIWIGLMQVTPLYLGWELVTRRRSDQTAAAVGKAPA